MEWAQGGSLAGLIQARQAAEQVVGMADLFDISVQLALAPNIAMGKELYTVT